MGKPGRPRKSMQQIQAEREIREQQNKQKRTQKIERLVDGLEAPNAMLLLQDPRNLKQFADQHNIKMSERELLKSKIEKKARD